MRKRLSLLAAMTTSGAVLCASAFAATTANIATTATVTGTGALTLTAPATATLSNTLDGSDQSATYAPALTLIDARGTGAGWNLTITSTTFTAGSNTLSTTASSVTGVTQSCNPGGLCTNPTNLITYPLTVPAATSAPAAVKLFNSSANTGLGRFTITPTISVSIPGNSFAGTYISTITISAVSGP